MRGILMSEKNKYCWDGCYDEKTEWKALMQSKIIDDVEYNYCPKCNTAWPLDWEQIVMVPEEIRQRGISRYIRDKEENPQDHWPDDDIQGGN